MSHSTQLFTIVNVIVVTALAGPSCLGLHSFITPKDYEIAISSHFDQPILINEKTYVQLKPVGESPVTSFVSAETGPRGL